TATLLSCQHAFSLAPIQQSACFISFTNAYKGGIYFSKHTCCMRNILIELMLFQHSDCILHHSNAADLFPIIKEVTTTQAVICMANMQIRRHIEELLVFITLYVEFEIQVEVLP